MAGVANGYWIAGVGALIAILVVMFIVFLPRSADVISKQCGWEGRHKGHNYTGGFLWRTTYYCSGWQDYTEVRNEAEDRYVSVMNSKPPLLYVSSDAPNGAKLQEEYEAGKMTANQVRAALGYPPMGPSGDLYIKHQSAGLEAAIAELKKPHKHKLVFTGSSWSGKSGTGNRPSEILEQELLFRCANCPLPVWPKVTIKRWKWNEMTRTMPKVDQVWPG